ncbi:MAG TPA: patatin-like phospholipase family protein [Candidatus Lustribacter sp.]|nr:patatin-like phospholipase family protein [Candidatus Lustribacter sp.]
MKALVLSGGGALGAYEAGAISVLCRHAEYDLVCGTSIGALNAAFVAQKRFDDLQTTWANIAQSHVITLDALPQRVWNFANAVMSFRSKPPWSWVSGPCSTVVDFFKIGPLSAVFRLLGALSPAPIAKVLDNTVAFNRLVSALVISGTNLTTGDSDAFYWFPNVADGTAFAGKHDKGVAHSLNDGNLRDAIRASAAIPFAFAPVGVTTEPGTLDVFVDGGVANNTPIGVAIDAGATDVTVIFLNPPDDHSPQTVVNLAQVGLTCFSVMQERILELDFRAARRVNQAIANGAGGDGSSGVRKPVKLNFVQPAKTLPITVLQFDRQDLIDQVYALGVADATRAITTF